MAEKAMRLSEAIRLGSMMRPQIRCRYLVREGSCALGAALEAIGGTEQTWDLDEVLFGAFPELKMRFAGPDNMYGRLLNLILHMNDSLLWTREAIADWVERLENERIGNERAPVRTGVPAEEPVTA